MLQQCKASTRGRARFIRARARQSNLRFRFRFRFLQGVGDAHRSDLSNDTEYSQRLQYLGDKQQNCTIRLSHVTQKDEHMYYFRFTTNVTKGRWVGRPGVTLNVTDLQVESPERVTEEIQSV
ncbi:hypothetical protein G5714_004188 [Onychostoma macrolepis]|uniref:Uncharacterized protein n=1 Tax=Onychostoma macrolepis TaxID=369639 RepID=A0A7J6DBV9_9TELE|nr:hypothetical protein G5714_004188 [Onychostoma macrolepis]